MFMHLMFEVITDSFAYPELYDGRLADLAFQNKVANEEYRPVLAFPVKETLQELAELCWSNNPEERPSFEEMFEQLCNENYFLEDADKEELNSYVEDITEITDSTEKLLNKIKELRKENHKLKTENEQNKKEMKQRDEEMKQKDEEIEALRKLNDQLKTRIEELEAQYKKESKQIKHELNPTRSDVIKCAHTIDDF